MTAPMPPLTAFEWQVMTRSEREHYLTAAFRPSTDAITRSIDAECDFPRWNALRMAYRAAVAKTLANP